MSEVKSIEPHAVPVYQDRAWHWVKYDGIEAPAMYRANVDCWYSYEFGGVPTRQLEVIGPFAIEPNGDQLKSKLLGVVLPDRKVMPAQAMFNDRPAAYAEVFYTVKTHNACLDEIARLNSSAVSAGESLPVGWVPLTIEYEPGYPEDVAFGPQRMMDRLKKWLDRYFDMRAAQTVSADVADDRAAFASYLKDCEEHDIEPNVAGAFRFAWQAAMTPTAPSHSEQVRDDSHPMQPIVLAEKGVIRFKQNRIVRHLLDFATPLGCGLNELVRHDFSQEDRMQLAQLIGYSVSGYGDLSYASRESVEQADEIAAAMLAAPSPGKQQGGDKNE